MVLDTMLKLLHILRKITNYQTILILKLSNKNNKLKYFMLRDMKPEKRETMKLLFNITLKLSRLCPIISKHFSTVGLPMTKLVNSIKLSQIINEQSKQILTTHILSITKVSVLIVKEIMMKLLAVSQRLLQQNQIRLISIITEDLLIERKGNLIMLLMIMEMLLLLILSISRLSITGHSVGIS